MAKGVLTTIQIHTLLTQDSAATIDVPDDGFLVGIHAMLDGTLNAHAESCSMQLSFGSTSAFTTNDSRQVIYNLKSHMGLLSSGAMNTAVNDSFMLPDPGIEVFGGERVHLHTEASGGAMFSASCILYFAFKRFTGRRR